MNGPKFFETRMGHKFYDGDVPRLVKALESIATSLERLADAREKAVSEAPKRE